MTSVSALSKTHSLEKTVTWASFSWCVSIEASLFLHSGRDCTPSPRQEKSMKAMSNSPSRLMSNGLTMGTSSTFDRLMMSVGTHEGGASSSARLQPRMTSSSLGLTPVLGKANDVSGMFAKVMTSLEELRQDTMKMISRWKEGLNMAMKGYERNWQTRSYKPEK